MALLDNITTVPIEQPPEEPLVDTWGFLHNAAWWSVDLKLPDGPGPKAANMCAQAAVRDTLLAFGHMNRFVNARLFADGQPGRDLPCEDLSHYRQYELKVLDTILHNVTPVWQIDLTLDLCAYVRTASSLGQPRRSWLRLHDELVFCFDSDISSRNAFYVVRHTLVAPLSVEGQDNRILHDLNQPLLGEALHKWERAFGHLCEGDGFAQFKYGFGDRCD